MKALLLITILLSGQFTFAKSPHDSDNASIDIQIMQGKVLAAEYDLLSREIARLETKLADTLSGLPNHVERNEGKIIALISNQVERDLETLKKDIEELSYSKSSNDLHKKLEEIEKDIEMI